MPEKTTPIIPNQLTLAEFETKMLKHLGDAEGAVKRIHSDNLGIPSFGNGTALAVKVKNEKGTGKKYVLRKDYLARLKIVTGNSDLVLTDEEQNRLEASVAALNKGDVEKAKALIPVYEKDEQPDSGNNKFSFLANKGGIKEMTLSDMKKARDAILEDVDEAGREQGLSAERIADLKTRLATSTEMIGLASARYNMGLNEKMPKTAKAIVTGDRAEAVFEMKYRTNEKKHKGLANRRAAEAKLVLGQNNDAAHLRLEKLREERKGEVDAYHSKTGLKREATDKANDEQTSLSAERTELAADFSKDDGPMAEIALKDGAELTGPELRQVMETRNRLPDGPEKDRLHKLEADHFSKVYGDDPVEVDDTGRAIEPQAKRAAPEKPLPAKATSGETLGDAMARLGSTVAANKGNAASAAVTQALQTGLNMILQKAGDRKNEAAPQKNKKTALFNTLKVDGQVGPKTRHAARSVLAKMQPGTAEEALALGQFKKIAERGRRKELDPDKLRQSTSEIFGPLYRGPEKSAPKASHEGVGLQMALNEIGKTQIKPLREDGVIGPKTAGAFGQVIKKTDPDDFISRLGDTFGFFG